MSDDIEDIERYLEGVPTFDRVVPVGVQLPGKGGGRVVLTSVELWSHGIIVRHASVAATIWMGAGPDDPTPFDWQVTDDSGNDYQMGAGGSGGGEQMQTGYQTFTPALRHDASVLRIFVPLVDRDTPVEVVVAE